MEMEERGARVHVDKKSDRQGSFLNRYKRGREISGFFFFLEDCDLLGTGKEVQYTIATRRHNLSFENFSRFSRFSIDHVEWIAYAS